MNYDANSIQVKSFRDACRDTPGCYLGADNTDGIFNCFLEILNNACDEAIMKRGNKIEVIISKDCNTCAIQDYGVGIPHGPNKNTDEVLIDLFTTAHSSGKFDNDNYKKVRGLHGLGSSAVCVCSTLFEVNSKRDGYNWDLSFKNGIPQTKVATRGEPTTITGTKISFTPDKTIFHMQDDEPAFSYDRIKNELRLTSYFIPNVTFSIECGETKETFLSKNGLKDFAKDNIEKPLHKSYIYAYKEFPDEVEIEVFGQWTGGKEERYIFSNGALNEDGGTPETGVKTAFTRTINSLSKGNFDADMIRKGLVYIVNIKHPKPIYQNQTKNKIQNPELRGYTQTVFGEAIKDFVNRHSNEFDRIVDVLTKEKKAEMAADRARKQVLEATKEIEKSMKEKIDNPDKLRDARKLGLDSTLLICEGLSAGGSMSIGRDPLHVGILMLRGKAINSISNPIEKVLNNEEIQLLLKALGINYNKPYNSSKLRYGKIAIAVDGDLDGGHIGLLITSALQTLCPDFIKENRLHWLFAPVYKVSTGAKNYYYYSEEEFENHPKGKITKFKGLGQMSSDDLKQSMFSNENKRLEPINFSQEGIDLLYDLMGEDTELKKEFVQKNINFKEIPIE